MVKASRVQKQRLIEDKLDQHGLAGLPHAEKLMAFVEGRTAPTPGKSTGPRKQRKPRTTRSAQRAFSAADAAGEAGRQIEALVRMKIDSVSAVTRAETGWEVIVNVVELARIPASTDLIAAYHVVLDPAGNLQSYSRGNRYTRGQTGEGI